MDIDHKNHHYQEVNLIVHTKVGLIDEEMIKNSMPPPGEDTFIAVCGPPEMNSLVKDCLKRLGYTKDMMN